MAALIILFMIIALSAGALAMIRDYAARLDQMLGSPRKEDEEES